MIKERIGRIEGKRRIEVEMRIVMNEEMGRERRKVGREENLIGIGGEKGKKEKN